MSGERWRGLVADLGRTATPRGRRALGRYLIEGVRLHERALRAGVTIERAAVARSLRTEPSEREGTVLAGLEAAGCRLETVPDEALTPLNEGRKTGGLFGLVPLPDPVDLRDVVGSRDGKTVVLAAVEVEDPGNVGAMIRTGLAGFADAFVAVGISDPWHPRAVRTSMGSVFKLPIVERADPRAVVEELRAMGFTVVGAVSDGTTPLADAPLEGPRLAILLGREAFGLEAEAQTTLDRRVAIPMASGVDSYSVNAAAAILLHEAWRRRSATG